MSLPAGQPNDAGTRLRLTRRGLIGRGVGAAGAAALPTALLSAELAVAQEDDETDALERLVELEHAAELAYSLAVEDGDLKEQVNSAFERYGRYAGEHATALAEAIDQLGVDPPEDGDAPEDYESLAGFDAQAPQKQLLRFMIGLEEGLIAAYDEEVPNLDAEDLVRSAAQIGAAHAQVFVALSILAGDPAPTPDDLPPASTSASKSEGEDSSSEDE